MYKPGIPLVFAHLQRQGQNVNTSHEHPYVEGSEAEVPCMAEKWF